MNLKKIITVFLVIIFCVFEIAPLSLYASVQTPLATLSHLPDIQLRPEIPQEFGEIREVFRGDRDQFVIVIQDAHAVPDAQRNIHSLLEYFQQQKLSLVALEGSASQMDMQFLRSFPDQILLKKILNSYYDQGALSGGVASAILTQGATKYLGLENWSMYEEGIAHFRTSMSQENELNNDLDFARNRLSKEKEKTYNPDLLNIDGLVSEFESNDLDMFALLKALNAHVPLEANSNLNLILQQGEVRADANILDYELKEKANKILQSLRQLPPQDGLKEQIISFNQKRQAFQISQISAEEYASVLEDISTRWHLRVGLSQAIHARSQAHQRMQALKGTQIYSQLETYVKEVKSTLIHNEQEAQLDAETTQLSLLTKLSSLELDYDGWQQIKQAMSEREKFPLEGDRIQAQTDLQGLLDAMKEQCLFYENAEKRDRVFFDNIEAMIKKEKQKTLALVAGGFHASGLTRQLKSAGISYMMIQPQIAEIPQEMHYRDQMQGEISWKDYLREAQGRVSLYEAFVRGTRDLLLEESPLEKKRVLKEWRDQIIQDLAEQGRLSEAESYTKFIDEALRSDAEQVRNEWLQNAKHFIEGLQGLEAQGQLNETQVMGLLANSHIPSPVASSLGTGDFISAKLVRTLDPFEFKGPAAAQSLGHPLLNLDPGQTQIEIDALPDTGKLKSAIKYLQEAGLQGITISGSAVWKSIVQSSLPSDVNPSSADYDPEAPNGEIDIILRDEAQYKELIAALKPTKIFGDYVVYAGGWKLDILGWRDVDGKAVSQFVADGFENLPRFSFYKLGLTTEGLVIDPFGGIEDVKNRLLRFVNPSNKPISYADAFFFLNISLSPQTLSTLGGKAFTFDPVSKVSAEEAIRQGVKADLIDIQRKHAKIEQLEQFIRDYYNLSAENRTAEADALFDAYTKQANMTETALQVFTTNLSNLIAATQLEVETVIAAMFKSLYETTEPKNAHIDFSLHDISDNPFVDSTRLGESIVSLVKKVGDIETVFAALDNLGLKALLNEVGITKNVVDDNNRSFEQNPGPYADFKMRERNILRLRDPNDGLSTELSAQSLGDLLARDGDIVDISSLGADESFSLERIASSEEVSAEDAALYNVARERSDRLIEEIKTKRKSRLDFADLASEKRKQDRIMKDLETKYYPLPTGTVLVGDNRFYYGKRYSVDSYQLQSDFTEGKIAFKMRLKHQEGGLYISERDETNIRLRVLQSPQDEVLRGSPQVAEAFAVIQEGLWKNNPDQAFSDMVVTSYQYLMDRGDEDLEIFIFRTDKGRFLLLRKDGNVQQIMVEVEIYYENQIRRVYKALPTEAAYFEDLGKILINSERTEGVKMVSPEMGVLYGPILNSEEDKADFRNKTGKNSIIEHLLRQPGAVEMGLTLTEGFYFRSGEESGLRFARADKITPSIQTTWLSPFNVKKNPVTLAHELVHILFGRLIGNEENVSRLAEHFEKHHPGFLTDLIDPYNDLHAKVATDDPFKQTKARIDEGLAFLFDSVVGPRFTANGQAHIRLEEYPLSGADVRILLSLKLLPDVFASDELSDDQPLNRSYYDGIVARLRAQGDTFNADALQTIFSAQSLGDQRTINKVGAVVLSVIVGASAYFWLQHERTPIQEGPEAGITIEERQALSTDEFIRIATDARRISKDLYQSIQDRMGVNQNVTYEDYLADPIDAEILFRLAEAIDVIKSNADENDRALFDYMNHIVFVESNYPAMADPQTGTILIGSEYLRTNRNVDDFTWVLIHEAYHLVPVSARHALTDEQRTILEVYAGFGEELITREAILPLQIRISGPDHSGIKNLKFEIDQGYRAIALSRAGILRHADDAFIPQFITGDQSVLENVSGQVDYANVYDFFRMAMDRAASEGFEGAVITSVSVSSGLNGSTYKIEFVDKRGQSGQARAVYQEGSDTNILVDTAKIIITANQKDGDASAQSLGSDVLDVVEEVSILLDPDPKNTSELSPGLASRIIQAVLSLGVLRLGEIINNHIRNNSLSEPPVQAISLDAIDQAVKAEIEALIGTLAVVDKGAFTLGLAREAQGDVALGQLVEALSAIGQYVNELLLDRNSRKIRIVLANIGDFPYLRNLPASLDQTNLTIMNDIQKIVPVIAINQLLGSDAQKVSDLFYPVAANVQEIRNPQIALYVQILQAVAAVHAVDLTLKRPELLRNPEKLKGELLTRLGRFEDRFQAILANQAQGGRGLIIDTRLTQLFIEAKAQARTALAA